MLVFAYFKAPLSIYANPTILPATYAHLRTRPYCCKLMSIESVGYYLVASVKIVQDSELYGIKYDTTLTAKDNQIVFTATLDREGATISSKSIFSDLNCTTIELPSFMKNYKSLQPGEYEMEMDGVWHLAGEYDEEE